MQGSMRKRCQCPPRRDRLIPCPKPHGSWSFTVDVPASPGIARRQVMRGGFATKKDAEQALAEFVVQVGRGHVPGQGRQTVAEYVETERAALAARAQLRHAYTDYEEQLAALSVDGNDDELYRQIKAKAQDDVDGFLAAHRATGPAGS